MSNPLPGFFEGTEMPTAGWWEALWPDPAKVLESVGLTSGMDVVDLCSGDGWFTLQIARIARRAAAGARVKISQRWSASSSAFAINSVRS